MTRARTRCHTTASQIARETGTLSELALALSARTPVLVFCGELSAAASTVAETQSVQEATGISSAPYGALILEAWQGRPREARELIAMTHTRPARAARESESPSASMRARSCATASVSTKRRSPPPAPQASIEKSSLRTGA